MSDKKYGLGTLLVACCCSAVLTLGGCYYVVQRATGSSIGTLKLLRTLDYIHNRYVGDYDDTRLFDGAISGMVKTLDDPYSVYMNKEAFTRLQDSTEGFFGGIGVVVGKKDKDFVVVAPLEGTPGDKAGIRSGDVITAVNGEAVDSLQLEEVVGKIRGEKGTAVELTLRNKENELRTVKVVRDEIKLDTVMGKMLPDSKIGYLRIAMFNETTGSDFNKAYKKLEEEGMEAMVLDLRQNPGGLLKESIKVADKLVPKGTIVSIIDNQGKTTTYTSSLAKVKYPLAVLVDHGSASASEIVAGAIKDSQAGKLFGVTTFGKGVVQTIYPMSQSTGLKLTTAKYYTPNGSSIHKIGIKPDVEVELTKDSKEDVQLKAAEKYLQEQLGK